MPNPFAHFCAAVRLSTALVLAQLLAGCAAWRPVTVPIATIRAPSPCAVRPDTLFVMLPGSYSLPQDFEREGFVEAVRRRGIAADLLLVDAHVGYYRDRSILERLGADVVRPALAQGYTHVWLVGISIGAFGAIAYSGTEPAGIAGLVLLGPYLGEPAIADAVRAQGGLKRWRAPDAALGPDDIGIDAVVWRWLQPYATAAVDSSRPALFLGYGRDDRFIASDTLLADALPADRVAAAPGGHDWPPWKTAWDAALDTLPFERGAGCQAAPR